MNQVLLDPNTNGPTIQDKFNLNLKKNISFYPKQYTVK